MGAKGSAGNKGIELQHGSEPARRQARDGRVGKEIDATGGTEITESGTSEIDNREHRSRQVRQAGMLAGVRKT